MLTQIRGTVVECQPLRAVIEAGGLGYEVHIPITTAEKVPRTGGECLLYLHPVYREDSQTLYGFHLREDRDFFRLLVEKVSGIGPKTALTIFSRMSVEILKSAINAGDVALLSKCPGIGKKTAERIIIELKDKKLSGGLPGAEALPAGGGVDEPSAFQDTVSSLVILGYKLPEADKMARKAIAALGADAPTEQLLKKALS